MAAQPHRKLSEGETPEQCRTIYNEFYRKGGWKGRSDKQEQQVMLRTAHHAGWHVGDPILEVGCGTGQHAAILARGGCKVTAVDISEVGIARAKKRYGGPSFVCADLRTWTPPRKFAGIYSRGMSFFHYELDGVNRHGIDVPAETARMFKWLRRGGSFVLQICTDFSGKRPEGFVHHNKLSDYIALFQEFGEVFRVTDWNDASLTSDAQARSRGKGPRSGIIIYTRK